MFRPSQSVPLSVTWLWAVGFGWLTHTCVTASATNRLQSASPQLLHHTLLSLHGYTHLFLQFGIVRLYCVMKLRTYHQCSLGTGVCPVVWATFSFTFLHSLWNTPTLGKSTTSLFVLPVLWRNICMNRLPSVRAGRLYGLPCVYSWKEVMMSCIDSLKWSLLDWVSRDETELLSASQCAC